MKSLAIIGIYFLIDRKFYLSIDCKQSIFFPELARRMRERRAAKPRDARSRAADFRAFPIRALRTRVCIFQRFVRRAKKKERLLLVHLSKKFCKSSTMTYHYFTVIRVSSASPCALFPISSLS